MGDPDGGPIDHSADFERALADQGNQTYELRLYIAGLSLRSRKAIATIRTVCEQHLKGRYQLEVIDIYRKPQLAADEQILAVPTLLKSFPPPLQRVIGDLSDQEKVLFGLDLKTRPPRPEG